MDSNQESKIWELIIKRIEEEKCVLIIGPDITIYGSDKSLNEQLKECVENNAATQLKYYADDEFFSFTDDMQKECAFIDIQDFYKNLEPNDFHFKIAAIPFHLIISISPDHILKDVFDDKKISYQFDFYNKESNLSQLSKPSKNKPLIYNLFGDIDTDGSLIFTYDDLFEYLISIFGKFELPQELQKELQAARLVLFIGFKFDKWYFKLLLRLLKLHQNKINNAAQKNKHLLPLVKNFYSEEFKVNFLDYEEIDIINNIYDRCKEKNLLRGATSSVAKPAADIFISYAWEGESEAIVDLICTTVSSKGYHIIRDKVDLGFKGNIRQFMQTIGKGKYVIVVISDKYLKSENRMFEMLEISKNSDLYNRIFPVVLQDAKMYNETERIDYINYWDDKIEELKTKIKTISNPAGTKQVIDKLDQYSDIRRIFDEITDLLRNMNTLTPQMHKDSNFSELVNAIAQQIKNRFIKPESMENDAAIVYRYPGTKPFQSEEYRLFNGRDEDVKNLYELISIQSLIVLYGRSGLGKSSLLNAGLTNRLKEEGTTALFIRFGGYYKGNEQSPIQKITETVAENHDTSDENFLCQKLITKEEISSNKLWYLFKNLQIQNSSKNTFILIFDQFEELFTYPENDIAAFKKELSELFFIKVPQQLRNLLKSKLSADKNFLTTKETSLLFCPLNIKLLLSIRSDKLSLLNKLSDYFPAVLKTCYELQPLSREQAEQAITEPAKLTDKQYKAPPYTFNNDTLRLILDALTIAKKSDPEPGAADKQDIETFQLQIVCKYVENLVIKKGLKTIAASDLGNLKEVFENHYINIIKNLSPAQQLPARKLIEEKLIIDSSRVCMPVPFILRDMQEDGMKKELIDKLIDTHILRAEHNNAVEISHDTLIEPILKSLEKRELELQNKRRLLIRNMVLAVLVCALVVVAVLGVKYMRQQAKINKIDTYQQQIDSANKAAKAALQNADTIKQKLDSVSTVNKNLSEKFRADSALQKMLADPGSNLNKSIKIQYFMQEKGDSSCLSYLREQTYNNIVLINAKAKTPDHKPNGLFYGSNTSLTELKVLALLLIKGGVKLQRVAVIPDVSKVQIINSSNNVKEPALTVDEVLKAQSREALDKGDMIPLAGQ